MIKEAIYAGTFDPLTLGHLDVISRATVVFDRLVLAVAKSDAKSPLFKLDERVSLAKEALVGYPEVEIDTFSGLLVNYARARGIRVLIRGLRAISDFEVEFQMALTNRKMAPDIETIFLMPKEEFSYLSSSMVREVADHGGDTSPFVPPNVEAALRRRFQRESLR